MTKYRNECVVCPPEMGCLGNSCPNRNIPYLVCDKCGDEVGKLYKVDDKEVCEDCLLDMFERIEL